MKPKPILFGVRLASRWNRYNIYQNSKWIKHQLIHMGPAYVKMGQLVATRSDLFPEAITEELSSLHDKVPPCAFQDVRQVVEEDLGLPIDVLFTDFSEECLSSASIGQIHTATLKEFPDIRLAVKIQRPNIAQEFTHDMDSIVMFARLASLIVPNNKEMRDLYNVLLESRRFIENELDFESELKNIQAMRKAFEDDPFVTIPRTMQKVSTKRVLALEYIDSKDFKDVTDPETVTRRLVKSIVMASLKHGVVHGDLHPGNLGVLSNGVVLYDFGLVLSINPEIVKTLMTAVITNNEDMLLDALLTNNLVYLDEPVVGRIQLRRMIGYVIEYINTIDFNQLIENISNDITLQSNKLCFHVDSKLFLLSRTMTLLEGTCKSVDASFMYTDVVFDMMFETDYLDAELMMTKGVSDIQRFFSNKNTDTTDADNLIYFNAKMNSNQYNQTILAWIAVSYIVLTFFTL